MIFTGCFSLPQTSAVLVRTAGATQTYCYQIDSKEIEKRLNKFLNSCYSRKNVTVNTPYGTYTNKYDEKREVQSLENGVRYSISNTAGYVLAVDIFTPNADTCKTEVKMYGTSIFWKKNFDNIDEALRDGKIDCPL